MKTRALPTWLLALSIASAAALASGASTLACSSSDGSGSSTANTTGTPGGAGGAGGGGSGTGGVVLDPDGGSTFADFPAAPVVEAGLPDDIGGLFEGAMGSDMGGPCLAEPALDAMVPKNWTPLFFEWTSPPELNVFELRLKVENQVNELVVYTTQPTFMIDPKMWQGLTSNSFGRDIQVTLRGARLEGGALTVGPLLGASGPVHIAPVDAPGSVVYWTSSGGTSFQGFTIGDAKPITVLTPAMAGATSTGGQTGCVSCHTSSPDGKLVIYTRDADNGTRSIDVRRIDGSGPPSAAEVSPSALSLLGRHKQAAPVMSPAHYKPGDAVAISVFFDPVLTNSRSELIWTDLHAVDGNGWGILARNGDARQVSSPTWRHDGTAIAYVSATIAGEGVVSDAPAGETTDIYVVPYNNRMGGDAAPLAGASEPSFREFYPVYSPDDALVAFNRTDAAVNSYNQPSAELLVVPSGGGAATRLKANDPSACTGLKSPGLTNSWARWAPKAGLEEDLKYYWLVFSSQRRPASNNGQGGLLPQLYVSAVVTKMENGAEVVAAEYPAVYVTSQNPLENNHTPAWDVFEVQNIPR